MRKVECQRCGRIFPPSSMGVHLKSCLKMPKSEELAKIMDDDPIATPNLLAERFGVTWKTIRKRLEGTHWTTERIAQRTRFARREAGLRSVNWEPPGPYCPRCFLLNGTYDLCKYCHEEIESKLDRGAVLRHWDRPYVAGVMTT